MSEGFGKSPMPLHGGRGAFESGNLHQGSLPVHLCGDEPSHGLPDGVVVSTHICGEVLAVGAAVEEDDGDAVFVGPVEGSGDMAGGVGGHDEEVDLFVDEMLYLFNLLLVVITGGKDFKFHMVKDVTADFKFLVELVAPDVLAALRHADVVGDGRLLASHGKEEQQDAGRQLQEQVFHRVCFHAVALEVR